MVSPESNYLGDEELMKRMQIVITRRADVAEHRFEFFGTVESDALADR